MATARRVIAACLLLAVMSGLFVLAHGLEREVGGEQAIATAPQLEHSSTCAVLSVCAPFILASELEEGAFRPAVLSVELWVSPRSWSRSPYLADDGPPPRTKA